MLILEYVWLDGFGKARSKTKVIHDTRSDTLTSRNFPLVPLWNYDGSSTGQADGPNSEVILQPVAFFKDPFRDKHNCFLILCETFIKEKTELVPHKTNTRYKVARMFNNHYDEQPMFGLEQEFFISKNGKPIGITDESIPQQHYYCGTGGDNSIGRAMVETAFNRCLYAGLALTGLNSEVAPSQWELQVCAVGIEAADHLVMLRYIVDRSLEQNGYHLDLHPKPVLGDWNGSGCHINFSTQKMREPNGINLIDDALKKLEKNHDKHMEQYGANNNLRMTGKHETASYDKFTYGIGSRSSSIRIPTSTYSDKCGYLEDRRPASNIDPYVATGLIFETIIS